MLKDLDFAFESVTMRYSLNIVTVTMRYFLKIVTVTMSYFLNIVTVTMRYSLNIVTVTMCNLFLKGKHFSGVFNKKLGVQNDRLEPTKLFSRAKI